MTTPQREDIQGLDAYAAEQLVQRCLKAHAVAQGFDASTVSRRPVRYRGDGGMEISVELPREGQAPFTRRRGLFQIKATADTLTEVEINKEIDKAEVKGFLHGGQFVLVYTKFVFPKGEHGEDGKKHLESLTRIAAKHLGPNVDCSIWYPDNLEDLVRSAPAAWDIFPMSAAFLHGAQTLQKLVESNALAERGFDIPFTRGGEREAMLNDVVALLRDPSRGYVELRGNMGVGKTRLAYEAFRQLDLSDIVLWFEAPEELNLQLLQQLVGRASGGVTWIFVDECDGDAIAGLQRLVERNRATCRVLAVLPFRTQARPAKVSDRTCIVGNLSLEDLRALVDGYGLAPTVVSSICTICDGYPKLARVLAEAAARQRGALSDLQLASELITNEVFKDENTGRGWVTLILDTEDESVMGALALLTEVGAFGARIQELNALCEVLGLDADKAALNIEKNVRKGLLVRHGDFVSVTPLVLATHLALLHLRQSGSKLPTLIDKLSTLQRFSAGRTPIEAFAERVKFVGNDPNVATLTDRLLEQLRPFAETALSSDHGAQVILAFADSRPEAFLRDFVRDLEALPLDTIRRLEKGRRSVVWFLEKAAFYPQLFRLAVLGLRRLAIAENENWANNATGVFSGFFSPYLSGSAASIEDRFEVLKELVLAGDARRHAVDVAALAKFLTPSTMRTSGHENQLKLPRIDENQTEVSLEQYSARVHDLINLVCVTAARDDRAEILNLLFKKLRHMVRHGVDVTKTRLMPMMATTTDLNAQQTICESIAEILEWDSEMLPADAAEALRELATQLQTRDLAATIRRWTFAPLLHDFHSGVEDTAHRAIARRLVEQPDLLTGHRALLQHPDAVRSGQLLACVGDEDAARVCWEQLVNGFTSNEGVRLGLDYVYGSWRGRRDEWSDEVLDKLVTTESADPVLLFQVSRDIDTPRSFRRMLRLLATGDLRWIPLLNRGGRSRRLSLAEIEDLIDVVRAHQSQEHAPSVLDVVGPWTDDHREDLPTRHLAYLMSLYAHPVSGTMSDHYRELFFQRVLSATNDAENLGSMFTGLLSSFDQAEDFHEHDTLSESLAQVAHRAPQVCFQKFASHYEGKEDRLLVASVAFRKWWYHTFSQQIADEIQQWDERKLLTLVHLLPDDVAVLNAQMASAVRRFPTNQRLRSSLIAHLLTDVQAVRGEYSKRLVEKCEAVERWISEFGLKDASIATEVLAIVRQRTERQRQEEHEERFLESDPHDVQQ